MTGTQSELYGNHQRSYNHPYPQGDSYPHDDQPSRSQEGMSEVVRWTCLAGGGLATYAGVRRGGLAGLALGTLGGILIYDGIARHSPVPRKLADLAQRNRDVQLDTAITIDCAASELYNFWRGFTRLPEVMTFLDRVEPRGEKLTHWVASGPMNTTYEWDSEVTRDVPNQSIAWQSVEGSEIATWGEVRFVKAPGDRGTEVHLRMHYQPPGGVVGSMAGRFLSGLSAAVIKQNLQHLKARMETGEIPTNATTSQAKGRSQ